MIRNTDPMGQPSKAAAPWEVPPEAVPLSSSLLIISYHRYLWIFLIFSPFMFHIYSLNMFPTFPNSVYDVGF